MFPPVSGVWGWPWHGQCIGGSISLPNGGTKAMTQPGDGATWLYDLGLPEITRTVAQQAEDTANGYEWRNYALISGGTVNGVSLGANAFIHVDEGGKAWLITPVFTFPEYSLQRVRITLSIVRFGMFGEGEKTPVSKVIDGQCTYITYTSFGYTYSDTDAKVEDVWTNGARCLISVAKLTGGGPDPYLRDIYSLLEMSISGDGGADGSGLVFGISEVRKDTELTQGVLASSLPVFTTGLPNGITPTETSDDCVANPAGDYLRKTYTPVVTGEIWANYADTYDIEDVFYYARYAYYDESGLPVAARLRTGYVNKLEYQGGGYTTEGEFVLPCSGDYVNTYAVRITMTVTGAHTYGMEFLANDAVIESARCTQNVTHVQSVIIHNNDPVYLWQGDPDGHGGSFGVLRKKTTTYGAAYWDGSLSGSLGYPAVPVQSPGLWAFDASSYWDAGVYVATPLLNTAGIARAWRDIAEVKSTTATIIGTTSLGIQRMGGKAAAFFKPGATRTYGNVFTPLGVKTTSLTPVGNLYFSFQRKTGEVAFNVNPVCFV